MQALLSKKKKKKEKCKLYQYILMVNFILTRKVHMEKDGYKQQNK